MSRTLVDSGIEWIGKIPVNWKVIPNKRMMYKVKNICNEYNGEYVLSLTMNGVVKRDIDNPTGKMPESFDGYQIINKDSLIMCLFDMDVTPRCIGLSSYDGVTSPAYTQFKLFQPKYNKYYYYYYLYLDNSKELLHLSKNLRSSITDSQLGEIHIPVPSEIEATKIADYLDKKCSKIDKVIDDNNKEIELLNEYRVSYIDNQYKNNDCYKKIKFDVLVRNEKGTVNSGEKYIGLENIEGYTTNYIETNTDYSNSDGKKFYKGDLLINKLRPYLAKSYLAEFDGLCTGEIEVIRNFKGNMNYLKYFTISNRYLELVNSSTYGAKMPRANWDFIKNLQLPSISIEEQDKVVNNINKTISRINKVIEYRKKIIEKLEEYKKSLIYEVVTGKKEV